MAHFPINIIHLHPQQKKEKEKKEKTSPEEALHPFRDCDMQIPLGIAVRRANVCYVSKWLLPSISLSCVGRRRLSRCSFPPVS